MNGVNMLLLELKENGFWIQMYVRISILSLKLWLNFLTPKLKFLHLHN